MGCPQGSIDFLFQWSPIAFTAGSSIFREEQIDQKKLKFKEKGLEGLFIYIGDESRQTLLKEPISGDKAVSHLQNLHREGLFPIFREINN